MIASTASRFVLGFVVVGAIAGCSVSETDISSGTGGTSTATSSNGGSGPGAGGASTTDSTGGAGAGGTPNGSGGGTTSQGGSGAGGNGTGGSAECPPITVTDGITEECDAKGPLALSDSNTTICPEDTGVFWPAKIYKVPVAVGDCVHMRADNVGSPAGADLFGFILDPGGKSLLFDDELPCAVTNPDGYDCPEGGTTIETAGDAYVIVGAWEGAGCPATDTTPFALSVSVNGADLDVNELCAADLDVLIP